MLEIILGNISSGIAIALESYSGTRKKRNTILWIQTISQAFYIAGSLLLKGYSATVQNVATVLRNLFAIKGKNSRPLTIFLIVLPVVLGLVFNNRGIWGFLPIIANLEYSICIFAFKNNTNALKWSLSANNVLFFIFNLYIKNIVCAFGCIVVCFTCITSIYTHKNANQEAEVK